SATTVRPSSTLPSAISAAALAKAAPCRPGGGAPPRLSSSSPPGSTSTSAASSSGWGWATRKGDVPAARMADQPHRAFAERLDEAGDVRRVAGDGEVAAVLPLAGPAMAHAERDGMVALPEGRHLRGPGALVAERAVDHHHRPAAAGLGVGEGVAVD